MKLLVAKLKSFDGEIEKKLNKVDKFIYNQDKLNNSTVNYFRQNEEKKNKILKYCFNGFLVKYVN
jgi:hypothetical protein